VVPQYDFRGLFWTERSYAIVRTVGFSLSGLLLFAGIVSWSVFGANRSLVFFFGAIAAFVSTIRLSITARSYLTLPPEERGAFEETYKKVLTKQLVWSAPFQLIGGILSLVLGIASVYIGFSAFREHDWMIVGVGIVLCVLGLILLVFYREVKN